MNSQVPEVKPVYVGTPPTIDGILDEGCWRTASKLTGFVHNETGREVKEQTIVHVCYDSKNLYLAFECLESQMQKIETQYTKDGQPVWQDDSVEIFIAPYAVATATNFHHFAVNASGVKTYLFNENTQPNPNWQVKVIRRSDRWIAEIAIPFSSLTPQGKNEDCWRINFCREEHPSKETSTWAPLPRWFDSFWRFGKLLQPENGPRFTTFRSALIPTAPAGDGKGIVKVDRLPEVPETAKSLIPMPFEMHSKRNGSFTITRATKIVVGEKTDGTDMWAAEEINQEVKSRLGYELQVVRADRYTGDLRNVILVGEPKINSLVKSVCADDIIRCTPEYPGKEGYVLDVEQDRILIAGCDRLGTYWGAQTLRELIRSEEGVIGGLRAIDRPLLKFRGVHLLASRDALKFHSKLIEELFSRYKINHIVLQTDKVDWESHPEVRDPNNFMPKEDVRKLIEVARHHHITVTPLVQTLGHIEWAFRDKKNRSFTEDPDKPYAICPSNPDSYKFLFDIIDEAYDLFGRPEYFHAGLDEFDMIGRFPVDEECKKLGKHELFYQSTLKIYNHLKRKGCRMMMWGDILTTVGYAEKIDKLPRDIFINDWRYGPLENYTSIDFFKKHGFEFVGCTWYDPKNISGFSRYAASKGASGMLQTTWTGFETEEVIMEKWPEQVYAYILGAAWAWNPLKPALADISYEPAAVYNDIWEKQEPREKKGQQWFTVNLQSYTNIGTTDSGRKVGWLGQGRNCDLRNVPAGLVILLGIPYNLIDWRRNDSNAVILRGPSLMSEYPLSVEGIKVEARADKLHFLNTTAYPDGKGVEVGQYRIRYSDGSQEIIKLVYGNNIAAWNETMGSLAYGLAWKGKSGCGDIIRLRDFVWNNPHPEKTIDAIDFISTGMQAAPMLLAITGENQIDR